MAGPLFGGSTVNILYMYNWDISWYKGDPSHIGLRELNVPTCFISTASVNSLPKLK